MTISVKVTSSGTLDNTLITIEGIEDRYGNYHVSREIMANLTPGTNPFAWEFRLPACSSCAGISAGTYMINVTIARDGVDMDKMSHEVQIAP
jgi:hypothetical protein